MAAEPEAPTSVNLADERTQWQWAVVPVPDSWPEYIAEPVAVNLDEMKALATTRWYSLTADEAAQVFEGYELAMAEVEAAGHQVGEGIMLSRGFASPDVVDAIVELVRLTPAGIRYGLVVRRRVAD